MADYPVTLESVSRFRNKKDLSQGIKSAAAGEIDILIGTHRLLQKDVRFKDLALVIIDEEQRFGVKHKERLKELRTHVDVLNLTATPIPRTLYHVDEWCARHVSREHPAQGPLARGDLRGRV